MPPPSRLPELFTPACSSTPMPSSANPTIAGTSVQMRSTTRAGRLLRPYFLFFVSSMSLWCM